MLKSRVADHRGYVNNKVTSQAKGEHSLVDLRALIVKQIARKESEYRKERGPYHIQKNLHLL